MRNLLSGKNWQWLLPKSMVRKNSHTLKDQDSSLRQKMLLCKNNHKSFKVWIIDELYNFIVNKNRSLEIIASLRKVNKNKKITRE